MRDFFTECAIWLSLTIRQRRIVWNVSTLILCKLPTFFQQWNSYWDLAVLISPLDLNWNFWMLLFGSTLIFFFLGDIFECCSNWTSQFFPSHETDAKLRFVFISLSRLYFQISPNSLKSWKIGIFESPLVSCQIMSLSGMCKRGRESIYNGIASFQLKKCS